MYLTIRFIFPTGRSRPGHLNAVEYGNGSDFYIQSIFFICDFNSMADAEEREIFFNIS